MKPSELLVSDRKEPLMTRRDFGALIKDISKAVILSSPLVTQLLSCREMESQNMGSPAPFPDHTTPVQKTEEIAKTSDNKKIGTPIIEVDSSIQMPTHTFIDEEPTILKPDYVKMDDEQIKEIGGKLAEQIISAIQKIDKYIKNNPSPEVRHNLCQRLVLELPGVLSSIDPSAFKDLEEFQHSQPPENRNVFVLASYLNRYLIPAGYYLHVVQNAAASPIEANLHPILERKKAIIKDDETEKEVPIVIIDKGFIDYTSDYEKERMMAPAVCNETFSETLVFADALEACARRYFGLENEESWLPPQYRSKIDFETFKRFFTEDVLRHETTHVFLAEKSPNTRGLVSKPRPKFTACVDLTIGGKKGKIEEGDHMLVEFHEIATVGVQLHTNGDCPISFITHCGKRIGWDTYKMVYGVLPMAALQVGPDSPLKQEILERVFKEGLMDYSKIKMMILSDPEKAIPLIKEIAQIMYKVGLGLIRKAESGELPRVN